MKKNQNATIESWILIYLDTARENRIIFKAIHEYDINHYAIQNFTELVARYLDKKIIDSFKEDIRDVTQHREVYNQIPQE